MWLGHEAELLPRAKKTGQIVEPTEHTVKETKATSATRKSRYIYIHETFFFLFLCMTNFCLALREEKLKHPVSDIGAWKLCHVWSKLKDGEGEYDGKTEEHLTSYMESYQRIHPGSAFDEPILSETNEMTLVVIQPKLHVRYPVLDGVITPSVSYTWILAINLRSSMACAQPSQAIQHAVSTFPPTFYFSHFIFLHYYVLRVPSCHIVGLR